MNVIYNGSPIQQGREDRHPYLAYSEHTDHYSRTKQMAEELTLASTGKVLTNGKEMHTCALR